MDDLTRSVTVDLGKKVAELRRRCERTQEQLAQELGFTPQYLQRVERGDENLTVRSLAKLARALGVRVIDLFRAPRNRVRKAGRPRKSSSARRRTA